MRYYRRQDEQDDGTDNNSSGRVRPADPKLMYMNGWWLVVGGSYFNYPSREAAVKAACAAAKESK